MKKLFTATVITFLAINFSFGQQTVASDFYLMKNQKDAENVLKALNQELQLSETEYTKVNALLLTSAKSQGEQFAQTPAPDAQRTNIIKTRQTANIENNLKNLVGTDKFNIYLKKKASLDAQLKEIKRN